MSEDEEPIAALLTPGAVHDRNSIASSLSTPTTKRTCFVEREDGVECATPQPRSEAVITPLVPLDTAKELKELRSGLQDVRKEVDELRLDVKKLESSISDIVQEKLNILIAAVSEVKEQGNGLQNLITQRINRKKASETCTPSRAVNVNPDSPATPTSRGAACKRISPFYGTLVGNLVKMPVDEENAIYIEKHKYEQYFLGSATATSFVRRLMPHFSVRRKCYVVILMEEK